MAIKKTIVFTFASRTDDEILGKLLVDNNFDYEVTEIHETPANTDTQEPATEAAA